MALGQGRNQWTISFAAVGLGTSAQRLAVGAAAVVLTCLGVVTTIPGSSPAFADTVVDGCTIVANPTATHFTDCPGVDFSSADLSGVDLPTPISRGPSSPGVSNRSSFPL